MSNRQAVRLALLFIALMMLARLEYGLSNALVTTNHRLAFDNPSSLDEEDLGRLLSIPIDRGDTFWEFLHGLALGITLAGAVAVSRTDLLLIPLSSSSDPRAPPDLLPAH